jgi:hypothetical protein
MKIIVRKSDNVIIYGTNDNDTIIEVVDGNLLIDGQVIATDVKQEDYDLIESPLMNLIEPFFVGYILWDDGFFYTQEYIDFNINAHRCLLQIQDVYYAKSTDPEYTPEERQSFADYCESLGVYITQTYLEPTFMYPCPPDEIFPYYPPCSL